MNTHKRDISGFMLIEIVMATFMIGAVMALGYAWWNLTLREYLLGMGTINNVEQAQRSLRAMTDVVREARDGEDGAYPLSLADDQELIVYADMNGDLKTDRVRYFLDSGTLKRGIVQAEGDPAIYNLGAETVTVMAEKVTNGTEPVFYYYNNNWPGDTTANPLPLGARLLPTRYIEVKLTVDQGGQTGPEPVTMQVGVQLRNLKDDY